MRFLSSVEMHSVFFINEGVGTATDPLILQRNYLAFITKNVVNKCHQNLLFDQVMYLKNATLL
jgi:hypothetical protein